MLCYRNGIAVKWRGLNFGWKQKAFPECYDVSQVIFAVQDVIIFYNVSQWNFIAWNNDMKIIEPFFFIINHHVCY